MRLAGVALCAIAITAACSPRPESAPPPVACGDSVSIVTNFYRQALVQRDIRNGFEQFVSPGFIEHKPDIATSDREGAITFLEELVADLPESRWEMLRATGSGDLVAIHARFTPAPGAPPYAIADFFRISDCRIVEHWDVVAGPPSNPANSIDRF